MFVRATCVIVILLLIPKTANSIVLWQPRRATTQLYRRDVSNAKSSFRWRSNALNVFLSYFDHALTYWQRGVAWSLLVAFLSVESLTVRGTLAVRRCWFCTRGSHEKRSTAAANIGVLQKDIVGGRYDVATVEMFCCICPPMSQEFTRTDMKNSSNTNGFVS